MSYFLNIYFYEYRCFALRVCLCTTDMQCLGGQKRVLDFLKWELEIVASCHMSVRNRSRVLSKEQPVIFIVRHLSSLDRHFFVIHCLHKLNSEFQFESSHVLNSILP